MDGSRNHFCFLWHTAVRGAKWVLLKSSFCRVWLWFAFQRDFSHVLSLKDDSRLLFFFSSSSSSYVLEVFHFSSWFAQMKSILLWRFLGIPQTVSYFTGCWKGRSLLVHYFKSTPIYRFQLGNTKETFWCSVFWQIDAKEEALCGNWNKWGITSQKLYKTFYCN